MTGVNRDDRAQRIADNEARFRELNDRLGRELHGLVAAGETVEFVCECGSLECREPLRLHLSEYERVRARSRTFAVVPGHEIPDIEDVVERREGYAVVEKPLSVAAQVEAADPRTDG